MNKKTVLYIDILLLTILLCVFSCAKDEEEFEYPKHVIAEITVGQVPMDVAVTPDGGNVYVTNAGDNSVTVIRTSDNTVETTIPVSNWPWDVAVTPDGNYAYVTNKSDNAVTVIRTSDNTVETTIPVGDQPRGIAVTPLWYCGYARW